MRMHTGSDDRMSAKRRAGGSDRRVAGLKPVLLCCIYIIMTGLLLSGCGKKQQEMKVPELLEPVGDISDTAEVTRGDISNTKIYDAQVIPYTEELGFGMDGIVSDINVHIGDEVKQGDIIAVLDGAGEGNEYDNAVKELELKTAGYSEENLTAEYDIRIMETELKQLKSRLNKSPDEGKSEIKKQIDIKNADIAIAKADLEGKKEVQQIELKELNRKKEAAKKAVENYYLYATMDGTITYLNMEPGNEVLANSFVVALSDTDNLQIKSVFVSRRELNAADDYYVLYKDKHYGVIQHEYDPDEIDSLFDEEKTAYAYYDIKEKNPGFKAGDSLDLYVVSDEKKDVLMVPVNALYKEGSEYYVYKKTGDSKTRTEITVGTMSASMVQVVDGLEEGDVVYVKE